MSTKLIAIPDRRTDDAPQLIVADVIPRATDKQVKAATAKAALKVGKPIKHKPDAATIALREVSKGRKPNPRQQADLDVLKDVAQMIEPTPEQTKAIGRLLSDAGHPKKTKLDLVEVAPPSDVKPAPALPTTPYHGPMLALRQRLAGYQKAANGQPCNGDDVAQILGELAPAEVIAACLIALDIENPYLHLNIGQQSMSLRNKLRGQLKKGNIGMGVLREAVEVVMEARPVSREAQGEKA